MEGIYINSEKKAISHKVNFFLAIDFKANCNIIEYINEMEFIRCLGFSLDSPPPSLIHHIHRRTPIRNVTFLRKKIMNFTVFYDLYKGKPVGPIFTYRKKGNQKKEPEWYRIEYSLFIYFQEYKKIQPKTLLESIILLRNFWESTLND